MDELRGERVVVRPFAQTDAARLRDYRDDPETARYQGWDVPYTEDQASAFVAWAIEADLGIPGSWCQLGIADRDGNQLLGDIGVHTLMDEPNVVELGVTLAPGARGSGRATEAISLVLDHLASQHGSQRARAHILVDNGSSVALFERLGFARSRTRTAEDGMEEHVYELDLADR